MAEAKRVPTTYHARYGIIEMTVFGSPDKNPTSFTWQLHVITGYFRCGSGETLDAAIRAAYDALSDTIITLNAEYFTALDQHRLAALAATQKKEL